MNERQVVDKLWEIAVADAERIAKEIETSPAVIRRRDQAVWQLNAELKKLVEVSIKFGWPTRTREQWFSLLYWGNFASLPPLPREELPFYPVYKVVQTARKMLANQDCYWALYQPYRNFIIHSQKGS